MKYIFILNERAGKGKCTKILPNIEKACKNRNIDFEIRYISKEKSGYDIALEYKDEENNVYSNEKTSYVYDIDDNLIQKTETTYHAKDLIRSNTIYKYDTNGNVYEQTKFTESFDYSETELTNKLRLIKREELNKSY